MILIDPGHGGQDPGATRGELVEKDIALAVGRLVHDQLVQADVACALTRDADEDLSLTTRGALSEKYEATLAVSLHVNAADDDDTHGALFFYWPGNDAGRLVCERLALSFPPELRRRNAVHAATEELWPRVRNVLGKHKATAVLVEMGFATNVHDRDYLMTELGRLAVAESVAFALTVSVAG